MLPLFQENVQDTFQQDCSPLILVFLLRRVCNNAQTSSHCLKHFNSLKTLKSIFTKNKQKMNFMIMKTIMLMTLMAVGLASAMAANVAETNVIEKVMK